MYLIILKNYDSMYAVKTKRYDEEVVASLKWYFGYHDVFVVIKGGQLIQIGGYTLQTKKQIKEELEWKKSSYWFDEEGEELEEKIRQLLDVLVEEEQT